MKKLLVLLFLVPLFGNSQTSAGESFKIEGKLEGFAEGTSIKLYKRIDNAELASTTLAGGKFELKGSITEPLPCLLAIGEDRQLELFIEKGNISVKANINQPGKLEVEGSTTHRDYAEVTNTFLPLIRQLSTQAGSINKTMPGKERDDMMVTYKSIQQSIQEEIDKFINKKTNSAVAVFLLEATYDFYSDIMVLETRFNKLSAAVKQTESGKRLEQFIANGKIGAVGTQAIDFSQADTTGTPVSLSSFRGKYVLVDFWASWCGPCRQENPNVVDNFKKFSKKNFTVLGVSLDRPGQRDKWIEAIKADGLSWTHVSDLQHWNNAVARMYHVQGIPQNFLVDPNGLIIAKNLRGPDLQAKLCEVLGCE